MSFKKLFLALAALIVLGLIGIVALIGFVAYQGNALDRSSQAYMEEVIPPIITSWSAGDLMKHASPELKKMATSEQIGQLFDELRELGALKNYEKPTGEARLSYSSQAGKLITARYVIHANYTHGTAEVETRLIQHEGQWQVFGFHVNSPIFRK